MTQNNKDAALELAKIEIVKGRYTGTNSRGIECYSADYYPPKAVEAYIEQAEYVVGSLKQQLLATQEAYQRVVEALNAVLTTKPGAEFDLAIFDAKESLVNPPSLEALERKKLEDEIAVLEESTGSIANIRMIAERKAKLEKMK